MLIFLDYIFWKFNFKFIVISLADRIVEEMEAANASCRSSKHHGVIVVFVYNKLSNEGFYATRDDSVYY